MKRNWYIKIDAAIVDHLIKKFLLVIHSLGLGNWWINSSWNEVSPKQVVKLRCRFGTAKKYLVTSLVVPGYPDRIGIKPSQR